MDIIDALMQAGFTRHESVLYVTLCREGELTGYEASKLTGIPRSNAYLGLAGLCDKGGAYKISSETAQYGAVPVNELVENLKRKFSQVIKVIEEIPKVNIPKDTFVTINGTHQIVNKMKNLINEAQYRIYISIARNQLEFVLKELISAKERGLKVVLITSDCTGMDGGFTCYRSQKKPGSVRLITDSSNVLTGHLSELDATGLFSMNKNMVDVIKDSLTNEIKLINIENNQN